MRFIPKFVHFYLIPFTGLGLHNGYRGDQWLKNRLEIFKRFVIPSLLIQGSKDFYAWFCWRPEEEKNELVIEFRKCLDQLKDFYHLHTFGGISFYDDKYDDKAAKERLKKTLELSLPKLKSAVGEIPFVIVTLNPSDDFYLSSAAKLIKEKAKPSKILGFLKGYIMDYSTKEIAEYLGTNDRSPEMIKNYPDTSPPFYSVVFKSEDFLDPKKHFALIVDIKSHEDVGKHPDFIPLEGRGFVVGCHGDNISTIYNHPFRGRILNEQERQEILARTGNLFTSPIRSKLSMRLRLRKLINILPCRNFLKSLYYLLSVKFRKL